MASVLDVAKYVLSSQGKITTMKLEKLVYYCQAWSLGWDEVPLFDEDFEAWANGPVCPELFEQHRGLFVIDEDSLSSIGDYKFTDDERETMDAVLKYYGEKTPQYLSELTHKEDPWKNARGDLPLGTPSRTIITKESMRDYYGGLT